MTRDIDSSVVTASKQEVVRAVLLVRLDIASGDVFVTNAPFSVFWDWDGNGDAEFMGVGELGNVAAAEEGAELRVYTISYELSQVPSENISLAIGEDYQNRDTQIWVALLDAGHQVIGDPYLAFRGRLDTMDVELGDPEEGKIAVTAHSRFVDWERARIRRYTNEDQQNVYPGDKGFEFVAQMVEKELIWGTG